MKRPAALSSMIVLILAFLLLPGGPIRTVGNPEGRGVSPSGQEKTTGGRGEAQLSPQEMGIMGLREAMFYEKLEDREVQCRLCFRKCLIADGERGECRNRMNARGTLYSIVYAKPAAIQLDPIEKEPQNHMLPGTEILCFGTAGCNFRCKFCHNWHLSQRSQEEMGITYMATPEAAVDRALSRQVPTISFTYNEPTSFYEYVYDIARLAKEKGLNILWHSNGAMNPEPLRELLKYTDAVTIDLKGFTDQFYQEVSQAELEPVLETLKIIKEEGVWLEVVNLVVPTLNDDPRDIRRMCEWIRDNLGTQVPLHFNRFVPAHKLQNLSPTPVETLEKAYSIAREAGLEYVYIGNVPGHENNSTYCPACGKVVIQRQHFWVIQNNLVDGKCGSCGHSIPGLWKL